MLVVIADMKAKPKSWYPLDKKVYEGNKIENITLHFGLHQYNWHHTHILEKSGC